jgi:MFS family permease
MAQTTEHPAAARTLAVAAAGTTMVLIAFTTPLATLPGTAAGVHAGPAGQAWILSGMSVGCAAGLLSSGAIGDDYGRRRTFLAGAVILAAGSLLGAAAPDALVLVLARILQGLGGAAIVACSLGLIGNAYPDGPERARATGIWGAALGAGVAIGPFLALGLQTVAGWRLPYLAVALLTAVLAAAGHVTLAESRAVRPRPVDVVGAVLLALGLSALLAGLVDGRTGWSRPTTLGPLLLGVVLVAAFVRVEHRSRHPMLDLALLRRPDFAGALIAALATGAGVLSLTSYTPIIVELGLAGSALAGVAAMLAWSGLSALTPLAAGWLSTRVTPRIQLVAGLLGCAVGQLALFGMHRGDHVARMLPGLLIAGAANGVLNAALGRQAVSSVPAERAAMGSGANNTARYVGSAIGLALVSITVAGGGHDAAAVLHGWNVAVLITAAFSLAGALIVLLARDRAPVPALRRPTTRATSTMLEREGLARGEDVDPVRILDQAVQGLRVAVEGGEVRGVD